MTASQVQIDNKLLIHLVLEKPVLWDKTLDIFKDGDATRNAWHAVCAQLNENFDAQEDNCKNDFGK